MLNSNLKLNPKLFHPDVDQQPTRAGYGKGLLQLGETNPNVVALCDPDLCFRVPSGENFVELHGRPAVPTQNPYRRTSASR